jgi:hypothetical protein
LFPFAGELRLLALKDIHFEGQSLEPSIALLVPIGRGAPQSTAPAVEGAP